MESVNGKTVLTELLCDCTAWADSVHVQKQHDDAVLSVLINFRLFSMDESSLLTTMLWYIF